MSPKASWLVTLLVAAALAGCSDDDGDNTSHQEECPDDHDAMSGDAMDGAMSGDAMDGTMDHSAHGHDCPTDGPPATVTLTGLPATATVYEKLSFQWVLDTEAEESHAMRTEVRVANASMAVTNETGPDAYGELVQQKEHQNFGPDTAFDATFTPEEEGTYYFRAYAVVSGVHVWSEESAVEVGPVQPTGDSTTVTVDAGSAVTGATLDGATITVGDGIVIQNDDLIEHAFTFTPEGGGDGFTENVAAGESSNAIVFLTLGSWDFQSDSGAQAVTGSVQVNKPA